MFSSQSTLKCHKNKSHYGFTILELIVVILLVSLMAGLVSVRFGGGSKTRHFDTFMQKCVIFLYNAKNQAVIRHTCVDVIYIPDERQFQATIKKKNNEGISEIHTLKTLKLTEDISEIIIKPFLQQAGINEDHVISYSSIGSSNGAKVILKQKDGAGKMLAVYPLTGVIKIEDIE